MSRKRPWLAALLAFVYPGLGHVYLRSWLRAVVWFLLSVTTAALVVPEGVLTAFETGGLEAMTAAMSEVPLAEMAPLFIVRGLCIVDAYVSARRDIPYGDTSHGTEDVEPEDTCPSCGKELDEELDFCPWCTTELPER